MRMYLLWDILRSGRLGVLCGARGSCCFALSACLFLILLTSHTRYWHNKVRYILPAVSQIAAPPIKRGPSKVVLSNAVHSKSKGARFAERGPFKIQYAHPMYHAACKYIYFLNWKTPAVSTTDWMLETQLCKLRNTRHVRRTCLIYTRVFHL